MSMIWRSRRERAFGLGFRVMCYFPSSYARKLAGSHFRVKRILRNYIVIRIEGSAKTEENPGPVRCGQPITTHSTCCKPISPSHSEESAAAGLGMTAPESVACKVPHYPYPAVEKFSDSVLSAERCIQSQGLTTECGSKGLTAMSGQTMVRMRPSDASSHRPHRVPPIKQPLALEAAASRSGCPTKMGQ